MFYLPVVIRFRLGIQTASVRMPIFLGMPKVKPIKKPFTIVNCKWPCPNFVL